MVQRSQRVARSKQTRENLLYLLLSFPLGICYFCVIIIGFCFSILDLVVIGIPLMVLFIVVWWKLAAFERRQTIVWLKVDIPPMAVPMQPGMSRLQRFQTHMGRAVTWKSLLYLFLKFPFGFLAFDIILLVAFLMLAICALTLTLGFCCAPFVYLYYTFTRGDVGGRDVKRYMQFSLTGNNLALAPVYIINVLAGLWGQFARNMLGMSDNAQRLAQATRQAEQATKQAEQAEQSRRDLIVNVSHELRTPIASIRGHIESLLIACDESENRVPPPETLRSYLTIVHRESIRLGALFDDLLSVARAETNELRVNMTEVDAGEVVEEVYQTLMPLAKRERQITMIREIAPGLPDVRADRRRLVQVLLNLVRNAISYTPDGGIVSISLQRVDERYIALDVADTGIGIPPEDQERIFERFYRTDASRARTSGGSGLGLAIVRDFVIAMGGTISVESVVGEGSCFHVRLQVA